MYHNVDVIILGAGAAGMMCAIEAGKRGRSVLILEKTNKPGKKILMSGGGRCNFTNTHTRPEHFISHNLHFCKSALSRYTPWDFIAMVEQHNISYFEKKLGQLFCEDKASHIVAMLLSECQKHHVDLKLNQSINKIHQDNHHFIVECASGHYRCQSLVVATGGLSIPTLGGSPFGYQLATQFGLHVYPTRAGLVPITLHTEDKQRYESLSGISIDAAVTCHKQTFRENILFTHRGLSGPAVLQISSYWHPGDELSIQCLPDMDIHLLLREAQKDHPDRSLKTILSEHMVKRLLTAFYDETMLHQPMSQFSSKQLLVLADRLQHWGIKPNGTEGYRTAEVTLGGVDCDEISSKTMMSKKMPGLFFVGEVLDVTGWLGGFNFQWAWSSGWAAGQAA